MTFKWTEVVFIVFVVVTLAVSAMPKLDRYEVQTGGPGNSVLVKVDTWTGETWVVNAIQARLGNDGWLKVNAK